VSEPILQLIGVRAAYGRIEVLHGVDLVVPPASVVALLGPNGAGKTTTIKVATGQLTPTAGCLHIGGKHVNGVSPDDLARARICTIPEGRGIFPNLTVSENLDMLTFTGARIGEIKERVFTQFPTEGAAKADGRHPVGR
jgi:branched-chain amino acid transport system ATP-binding protein